MSAYSEYDNILDRQGLEDAGRAVSKSDHKIIQQTVLPRKILIKGEAGVLKIFVNQGEIVSYQTPEALEATWVLPPVSSAEQKILDKLLAQTDEAFENGSIYISMLDDQEKDTLNERLSQIVKQASSDSWETAEIVSLDEHRIQDFDVKADPAPAREPLAEIVNKTPEIASDDPQVINAFFDSIKGKVKFVYLFGESSGGVKLSGISGAFNENVCESVKPAFESWVKATQGVLSDAPKMIITGAASRNDSVLVLASDSNNFLIAETETHKFGMLVAFWDKARKTKSDAT